MLAVVPPAVAEYAEAEGTAVQVALAATGMVLHVLGALIWSGTLAVGGYIVAEAIGRLAEPPEVASTAVLVFGAIGLAANALGILVLTHYVPAIAPGQEEEWRALAASVFPRQIELGDDLHRVEVHPGVCVRPTG